MSKRKRGLRFVLSAWVEHMGSPDGFAEFARLALRLHQGRHIVQAALRQGQVHARKQEWKRQSIGQGPDEAIRALLQNADFYAGYPPVVVKRIRDGREVLE